MAARRLLIIMLILLGISSAIAIIAPEPNRDDSPSEESPTGATGATGATADADASATGETGQTGGGGATGPTGPQPALTFDARTERVRLGTDPARRIEARPGARLVLVVRSEKPSQVEVGGLGLNGFADPFAPAVFDVILPPEPGRFAVGVPGGKPSAILVSRPAPEKSSGPN